MELRISGGRFLRGSLLAILTATIAGCGSANHAASSQAPAAAVAELDENKPAGPIYVPPPQPAPEQATLYVDGQLLPIPTPQQAAWEDDELGTFFHLDIEVFDKDYQARAVREDQLPPDTHRTERGRGVPLGSIDAKEFDPTHLDTDQWMRVAKSMGARYAVFTAKHSSGFLMWPSDLFPYGVRQAAWEDGKGDVVADYLASCRKFGISPGLYCSAEGQSYWMMHHARIVYHHGVLSGPPEVAREFLDMDERMYAQLWEHAGPIGYMWFDGGVNPFGPELSPIIARLEPKMVCFNGPMGGAPGGLARWSGNEKGYVVYPTWDTTDITNDQIDRGTGSAEGKYWVPVEANVPLRYHVWMWQSDTQD
ncbi:MAG TPA: alpha-L-fucosidase, partial [Tepidisphaeraceae bacterium]|nr:alpha-L-fucosidase [Tepidisphaeraceae bacterium]